MNIKIYVANLGKYNEGILQGEWFTLPHDIKDIYVTIGVGQYDEQGNYNHGVEEDGRLYEEFAIHDYEAPFEISEYSSINKLNELAEALQDISEPVANHGLYEPQSVINFALQLESESLLHDAHYHIGDIIDDDRINEMIKHDIDKGWERLKHFLYAADSTEEYHHLNGAGNIERLTNDILTGIVEDIYKEILENN
ncbi:hypothetical protein GCM10008931_43210 [Oceanobacillus oncorhynchi subsp. oncorhynchi]|uniref:antirestriction protein ArdA n=1 Tax=Oceanobacillus oncorhynchi TaxID=545501 RepID=UPI0031E3EFEC